MSNSLFDDIQKAFNKTPSPWVSLNCVNCGVPFCLEVGHYQILKENGHTFYCPNGHGQSFTDHANEIDRLKKQLAQEAKQREKLEMDLRNSQRAHAAAREDAVRLERSRRATRAQVTRLKNKIALGDCPLCGAHYEDLKQHMQAQHPDFLTENTEELDETQPGNRESAPDPHAN